ncbi:archease [Candidatus Parcubacteria bacterium]|nr:archease [Candidatus Parcubacteria bacterium]
MKYQILEHTADLKIKVFGKTKEELFENAMIGMLESAKYEPIDDSEQLTTEIKISSLDLPSLLVDFLSEVLYLVETKKEVYQKVKFKKFSKRRLEALLFGKKLKRMGVHIKGVTYHDLKIKKRKDKIFEAEILFDI